MKILSINSTSFSPKARNKKEIEYIIVHYTGMQSKRVSIDRLKSKKHKVSCHYLIDRAGFIARMVGDNSVAWHAGKSRWKNLINLNERSIGIELVNKGHKFGYEKFSKKQINSLVKLCLKLKAKYKIKKNNILGHSDIAPLRKLDPGEKFPWHYLGTKGIGMWYSKKRKKKFLKKLEKIKTRNNFFKNLHKIGYRYFDRTRVSKKDKLITKAFQRRFRQDKVDGIIDQITLDISDKLAKF